MSNKLDELAHLHTTLVDSRKGYEEAVADAEGAGLTPLFQDMIALRTAHESELAQILTFANHPVDDSGSFMATVHKTVISIRSLFGGLDESILPGLIDGEQRILDSYDETIKATTLDQTHHPILLRQRQAVLDKVDEMEARKSAAAA